MKIAYLILAHEEVNVLNTLVKLLDYPDNEIYVLIDNKSCIQEEDIYKLQEYAPLNVYRSDNDLHWGGYSIIEAELFLFEKASKDMCDYYCLLSGVDLPIKHQAFIHDFLNRNKGKEFVGINWGWVENKEINRYNVYHFFQERVGRERSILWILERFLVKVQSYIISRQRGRNVQFEGGPQWCCITDSFLNYVLSKSDWIKKTFWATECCDEIFIQTLLCNSEFLSNLYKPHSDQYEQCVRLIKWEDGKPYIWQEKDYYELIDSHALFARKFSESIDAKIIEQIYEYVRMA